MKATEFICFSITMFVGVMAFAQETNIDIGHLENTNFDSVISPNKSGLIASNVAVMPINQKNAIKKNKAPEPIYTLSEAERRLQGSPYFGTHIDAFERTVTQVLGNPPPKTRPAFRFGLVRTFKPGETTNYALIADLTEKRGDELYHLNKDVKMIWLVDGQKFTLSVSGITPFDTLDGMDHVQDIYGELPEELVRKLGAAREVEVRLPCEGLNFDYTLTQIELDRVAIFVRTYMPVTSDAEKQVK